MKLAAREERKMTAIGLLLVTFLMAIPSAVTGSGTYGATGTGDARLGSTTTSTNPHLPAVRSHDRFSGTWVTDPACGGIKGELPPSFTIVFKSRDSVTGKSTYHVSFRFRTLSPIPGVAALQTFEEEVVARSADYMELGRTPPNWSYGGGLEVPKLQLIFDARVAGVLRVGMMLFVLGGSWEDDVYCHDFVRK